MKQDTDRELMNEMFVTSDKNEKLMTKRPKLNTDYLSVLPNPPLSDVELFSSSDLLLFN